MQFVLWASVVLAVAAATASIMAKVLLWSGRRPTVPRSDRPSGSVAVGAAVVGAPDRAVQAQLADWHIRRVVDVAAIEPIEAEDAVAGVSGGPRWRMELVDRSLLDEEEHVILEGIFPPGAPSGTVVVLDQRDQESRDALGDAITAATLRRIQVLGGRVPVAAWVARVVIVIALVAAIGMAIGAASTLDAGSAAAVWISAVAVVSLVVALCARPTRLPNAELEFRSHVRGVRQFVASATTNDVRPELLGWAMLWNLPGPWADIAPDEVKDLQFRERAFRRIDTLDVPIVT